ncbi:CLUMA_CG003133, isoform A [Clunio marinus]|uniref:CLUMA_CG003133, isoform A n=1 Tax=Clunio marinus TaxID=568069 RepID=A0A1J1HN50_9DIPT|nr:CLUMA_CG003133, isoform A [Clunio marinus]
MTRKVIILGMSLFIDCFSSTSKLLTISKNFKSEHLEMKIKNLILSRSITKKYLLSGVTHNSVPILVHILRADIMAIHSITVSGRIPLLPSTVKLRPLRLDNELAILAELNAKAMSNTT